MTQFDRIARSRRPLRPLPAGRVVRGLTSVLVAASAACASQDATAPVAQQTTNCSASTGYALSLAVGAVAVVSSPSAMNCLLVPAQPAASEYLFVTADASTTPDTTWSYSLTSASASAAAADLVAWRTSSALAVAPRTGITVGRANLADLVDDGLAPGPRFEARRRATTRRLSFAAARQARSVGATSATARRDIAVGTVPNVGDLLSLRVPDTTSACGQYFTIGARVQAVSQHAIIVQDTTAPASGFTSADFSSIAAEFDQYIYPTDTVHFGSPGDIDQNGHVVLAFTPRVNAETPRSAPSYVEGFFFGGDLFPRSQCSESNVGEIFYLVTPDPNGQFSLAHSVASVRQATRGTVAHEFQHMINLATRIDETAVTQEEVTWLDEALAHFAEELVGRAECGFDDMHTLTIGDIADASNNYNDFDAFFDQNLERYEFWLERPDTAGAISTHADASLAVRGAAWSLVRYAADQYASGDVAGFTRRLVAGPDTGVANLAQQAGTAFETIMAGWMPAHYTSGLGVPNLPASATFVSWGMRSAESAINGGTYPLRVTALGAGSTLAGQVPSAGGAFYRLSSTGATPATIVRVVSPTSTLVSAAGARVYIVRTR